MHLLLLKSSEMHFLLSKNSQLSAGEGVRIDFFFFFNLKQLLCCHRREALNNLFRDRV